MTRSSSIPRRCAAKRVRVAQYFALTPADGLTETNSCAASLRCTLTVQRLRGARRRRLHATANGTTFDGADPLTAQSTGLAALVNDIRIVDLDSGKDVPTGDIGEVWVRGPNIALGCAGDTR